MAWLLHPCVSLRMARFASPPRSRTWPKAQGALLYGHRDGAQEGEWDLGHPSEVVFEGQPPQVPPWYLQGCSNPMDMSEPSIFISGCVSKEEMPPIVWKEEG